MTEQSFDFWSYLAYMGVGSLFKPVKFPLGQTFSNLFYHDLPPKNGKIQIVLLLHQCHSPRKYADVAVQSSPTTVLSFACILLIRVVRTIFSNSTTCFPCSKPLRPQSPRKLFEVPSPIRLGDGGLRPLRYRFERLLLELCLEDLVCRSLCCGIVGMPSDICHRVWHYLPMVQCSGLKTRFYQ